MEGRREGSGYTEVKFDNTERNRRELLGLIQGKTTVEFICGGPPMSRLIFPVHNDDLKANEVQKTSMQLTETYEASPERPALSLTVHPESILMALSPHSNKDRMDTFLVGLDLDPIKRIEMTCATLLRMLSMPSAV